MPSLVAKDWNPYKCSVYLETGAAYLASLVSLSIYLWYI